MKMYASGVLIIIMLMVWENETRMLAINYGREAPKGGGKSEEPSSVDNSEESFDKKVLSITKLEEKFIDRSDLEYESELLEENIKRPCAIVVVSNVQSPSKQSLLRKYRYDANGLLIPSSVKYFIKMPQGIKASPIMVPLNDKAFSPQGGFVRYYKEVPPIPRAW